MEKLYDLWAKRNPEWDLRYEDSIIKTFCDYGRGTSQYLNDRGKIYGAGYEIFIIAFFIGLYADKTKPLTKDTSKKKGFGQPIQYWGNIETRAGRSSYPELRRYIFTALVAKTDIDLIALDKGDISAKRVVDQLIEKMEDYANYGFDYMTEIMEDNPSYFFKDSSFLRVFLSFLDKESGTNNDDGGEEPESLD